jgi:D-arabinose 5-phosphate isomerase GutQ
MEKVLIMDKNNFEINDPEKIIDHVFDVYAFEINRLKGMDKNIYYQVANKLAQCRGLVHTSGCGTSAVAAQKVAHSLCCVEVPASYLVPSDAVHGGMGRLRSGDIMIFFSKGGNTEELTSMISVCKKKGVFIISVSEDAESGLAKSADIFVPIKIVEEPCRFNLLATASTLTMTAIFDVICILLMYRPSYSREAFLLIHPAGAVGEKLAKGI